MYAKGPYEAKCQLLINRRKSVDLNNCILIVKLLMNTRMIWMMFMNILKTTI